MAAALTAHETEPLAESWQLALRAERKSAQTLKSYGDGVRQLLTWCADHNAPPMSRASLSLWVAELLDAGAGPATARVRQLAVRRFAPWLADEGRSRAISSSGCGYHWRTLCRSTRRLGDEVCPVCTARRLGTDVQ